MKDADAGQFARLAFTIHHSSFRIPRRAFTLLELVIVMLIMTMLLAMVAPSLSGFGAGRQAEQAASQLLNVARWAREQAIAEGRTYRLNFDSTAGAYWVTAKYGGTFENVGVEFGRVFSLPEGMLAQWDAPQEGGLSVIEFQPTGRTQPVRIQLTARTGQVTELACLSPTEPLRVLSPDDIAVLNQAGMR